VSAKTQVYLDSRDYVSQRETCLKERHERHVSKRDLKERHVSKSDMSQRATCLKE